jgi:hypothetical protein
MAEELGKRIPNKYPNITEQGVKDGNNFEVYELQGDNLVKVKKNYIDFLSENRVVTTSVQPRVVNGVRTYFSQPNIRINTNIQDMKVLEKQSEEVIDKSSINLQDSDIIPNFEELFEQIKVNKETLTQKEVKQGERIKKYCNGTNVGKGNLIKR